MPVGIPRIRFISNYAPTFQLGRRLIPTPAITYPMRFEIDVAGGYTIGFDWRLRGQSFYDTDMSGFPWWHQGLDLIGRPFRDLGRFTEQITAAAINPFSDFLLYSNFHGTRFPLRAVAREGFYNQLARNYNRFIHPGSPPSFSQYLDQLGYFGSMTPAQQIRNALTQYVHAINEYSPPDADGNLQQLFPPSQIDELTGAMRDAGFGQGLHPLPTVAAGIGARPMNWTLSAKDFYRHYPDAARDTAYRLIEAGYSPSIVALGQQALTHGPGGDAPFRDLITRLNLRVAEFQGTISGLADSQTITGTRPQITETIHAQPDAPDLRPPAERFALRGAQVNIPFSFTAPLDDLASGDLMRFSRAQVTRTIVSNPAANIVARHLNVVRSNAERLAMLGVNTLAGGGTVLTRPGPQTRLGLARFALRR